MVELGVVFNSLHQFVDLIFQLIIQHDALKKSGASDVREDVLDTVDALGLEMGEEDGGKGLLEREKES